jgi:hypothetical protein
MRAAFCLQTPTALSTGRRTISLLLNVLSNSDVRQIEMLTDELLVTGPSHFEVEIAI